MNEMINSGLKGMAPGDKCCNLISVAKNRHQQGRYKWPASDSKGDTPRDVKHAGGKGRPGWVPLQAPRQECPAAQREGACLTLRCAESHRSGRADRMPSREEPLRASYRGDTHVGSERTDKGPCGAFCSSSWTPIGRLSMWKSLETLKQVLSKT